MSVGQTSILLARRQPQFSASNNWVKLTVSSHWRIKYMISHLLIRINKTQQHNMGEPKPNIRDRKCPPHLREAPRRHPYLIYESEYCPPGTHETQGNNCTGKIIAIDDKKINGKVLKDALSRTGMPLMLPEDFKAAEDMVRGADKFWKQVNAGTPDYCLTLDDEVKGDGDKCDGFYDPDSLKLCGNTGDWKWGHLDIGIAGECHSIGKECDEINYCNHRDVKRRPAYQKCEDLKVLKSDECNKYYGERDPESKIAPFCKPSEDEDELNSSYPCVSEGDELNHGCVDTCTEYLSTLKSKCLGEFGDPKAFSNLSPRDQHRRCVACVHKKIDKYPRKWDHMNEKCSDPSKTTKEACVGNWTHNKGQCSITQRAYVCLDLITKGMDYMPCSEADADKGKFCQSGNCKDTLPAADKAYYMCMPKGWERGH